MDNGFKAMELVGSSGLRKMKEKGLMKETILIVVIVDLSQEMTD